MNRLFEDAQTSPLKLAVGQQQQQLVPGRPDSGMFCTAKVLKVTDWVMRRYLHILANTRSSVIVNNELKVL